MSKICIWSTKIFPFSLIGEFLSRIPLLKKLPLPLLTNSPSGGKEGKTSPHFPGGDNPSPVSKTKTSVPQSGFIIQLGGHQIATVRKNFPEVIVNFCIFWTYILSTSVEVQLGLPFGRSLQQFSFSDYS